MAADASLAPAAEKCTDLWLCVEFADSPGSYESEPALLQNRTGGVKIRSGTPETTVGEILTVRNRSGVNEWCKALVSWIFRPDHATDCPTLGSCWPFGAGVA